MYEGLLCVCCLASEEEQLIDLFPSEDGADDYSLLLRECFDVQVSCAEGHSHVCAGCAARLKDASEFKRQIRAALMLLSSQFEIHKTSNDANKDGSDDDESEEAWSVNKAKLETNSRVKKERKIKKRGIEDEKKLKSKGTKGKKKRRDYGADGPIQLRPCVYPAYKPDASDLRCRECPQQFHNLHTLRTHLNEHYRNFGCRRCEKAFVTYEGWRRHRRTHEGGTFPCKQCDKVYGNENTLMSHARAQHGRATFACGECGERFATQHRRAAHLRDAHAQVARYACPHCPEEFYCSSWRARHVYMKHTEARYECALCEFKCRWKGALRGHLAVRRYRMKEK